MTTIYANVKDFCTALPKLVGLLGRGDIATLEALCTKITGDLVSGMMLRNLLFWWPKAVREGGWIWKSWRDWDAELGISRSLSQKGNEALRRVGVVIETMQAMGAPTNHYRLDLKAFIAALAWYLKLPVQSIGQVVRRVYPRKALQHTPQSIAARAAIDCSTPLQSITDLLHINNKHVVVEEDIFQGEMPFVITTTGLLEGVARQLVGRYGLARVEAVCRYAGKQTNLGNPAGFVVAALKRGLEVSFPTRQLGEMVVEMDIQAESVSESLEPPAPPQRNVGEEQSQPQPDSFPMHGEGRGGEGKSTDADGRGVAEKLLSTVPAADRRSWSAAYNQLEMQLDRASFDTWLRGATLVSVEGDLFTVLVRNEFAQEKLQHRLYRNVWKVLKDVRGQEVRITFVTAEEREKAVAA